MQSSRSHQIVTIMLESRKFSASPKPRSDSAQLTTKVAKGKPVASTTHSTITFVDLAGSEPAASHIPDAARIKYATTGPLPDDKQRKLEVCDTAISPTVIGWKSVILTSNISRVERKDKPKPADPEEGYYYAGRQADWQK